MSKLYQKIFQWINISTKNRQNASENEIRAQRQSTERQLLITHKIIGRYKDELYKHFHPQIEKNVNTNFSENEFELFRKVCLLLQKG